MQRATCYKCQKQGHWAKDCPETPQSKPSSTQVKPFNFQRIPMDNCYACHKQGHWAKDCPETPKCNSSSTRATVINDQAIPAKQCPCRAGVCIVKTSYTEKNFMRKFYKCPRVSIGGEDCGLFQWCDRESPGQRQDIPECSCGAGVCRLEPFIEDGRDTGLKYFACPVKKGQGACNFFQWQHSPGNPPSNDNRTTRCSTSDGHVSDESVNISSFNGIVSPESAEKGLEHQSSGEHLEEIDGPDFGLDDAELPPIGDLKLSGMKTSIFAKPDRCYRCGKEGHWKKDCLEP